MRKPVEALYRAPRNPVESYGFTGARGRPRSTGRGTAAPHTAVRKLCALNFPDAYGVARATPTDVGPQSTTVSRRRECARSPQTACPRVGRDTRTPVPEDSGHLEHCISGCCFDA